MGKRPKLIIAVIGCLAMTGALVSLTDTKASSPTAKKSFVGSDTCRVCHKDVYKSLDKTAHTKKTQLVKKKYIQAPLSQKIKTTPDGKVKFKLFLKGKRLFLSLYNLDGTGETTYRIGRLLGGAGKSGKQRFMIHVGLDGKNASPAADKTTWLISPVQYNHKDKQLGGPEGKDTAFSSYHTEHWYNDDGTLIGSTGAAPAFVQPSQFANSWERRCIGCHATGADVQYDKATGMFLNKSVEFNVWCESCHGPGSAHVDSLGDTSEIINPDKLKDADPQKAIDICARCHIRGSNVGKGKFGTGYPSKVRGTRITMMTIGKKLKKWYTPGEGLWGSDDSKWKKFATETKFSKQHHQQGFDFVQSEHWNNPSHTVYCWDCHDPHSRGVESPQLRKSNDTNELCLSCHASHGFGSEDEITSHTQHPYDPDGKGTSRCSKCHMPKTAKSQASWNEHAGDIHSHTFEAVHPGLTKLMAKKNKGTDSDGSAIPNGCNGCHDDKDYGQKRFKRWKNLGGGQVSH